MILLMLLRLRLLILLWLRLLWLLMLRLLWVVPKGLCEPSTGRTGPFVVVALSHFGRCFVCVCVCRRARTAQTSTHDCVFLGPLDVGAVSIFQQWRPAMKRCGACLVT
jgi:hypothetical protein